MAPMEMSLRDRALVAYERGEGDVLAALSDALAVFPNDGGLLIAEARARSAAGDPKALDRLEAMVRSAPDWLDGHVALAQLRWEAGRRDSFLEEFEAALQRMPGNVRLWLRYVAAVAGSGDAAGAANLTRRLRELGADGPELRLIEARHAGMAGELARAETLLATIADTVPDKVVELGRHRLRLGDPAGAAALLEPALMGAGIDTAVWALLELAWRSSGDRRHAWLVDPPYHIGIFDLGLDPGELGALSAVLHRLHHLGGHPLGQSLRDGTQTPGNLWRRGEAEIAGLRQGLRAAVAEFAARLPAVEPGHPLRRCLGGPLDLATGWSVRLRGGGHHVSHIHAFGVLSSACYIELPDGMSGQEGWLELGRPPADIPIDLAPIASIEPRPGRLVLFPSYLYHGTRPFPAGERLTVAFDVAPVVESGGSDQAVGVK